METQNYKTPIEYREKGLKKVSQESNVSNVSIF